MFQIKINIKIAINVKKKHITENRRVINLSINIIWNDISIEMLF